MSLFLLDTSVAIPLRDFEPEITRKIKALDGALRFSVVTRVELEGGVVRKSHDAAARRARLDVMLRGIPTLVFDNDCAKAYGMIISAAGYSRRKLLDRMIAAQALVHRATLVTLNPADFADVPGLTVRTL